MKIGDRVTWTHHYLTGSRTHNFTTREGKIIAINSTNVTARCKGQNYTGHESRFRLTGETTELTDLVMKKRG